MSVVKSRIASFEQHNQYVRNTITSPVRTHPDRPAEPTSPISDTASTTSLASQNRRTRILKEQKEQQQKSSSSSPSASLAERRRARRRQQQRQQQQQQQQQRPVATNQPNGRQTPPPHRRRPVETNNGRRRKPTPETERNPLTSNRRFVHSISQESSEEKQAAPATSTTTLYSRKVGGRQTPPNRPSSRGGPEDRRPGDEDLQYHSVRNSPGTDDEATLTSVRQIMRTSPTPGVAEETPPPEEAPSVLRTASSSSYDTNRHRAPRPPPPRQTTHQYQEMDVYDEIRGRNSQRSTPTRPMHDLRDDADTFDFSTGDGFDDEEDNDDDSVTRERKKRDAERKAMERIADGYVEGDDSNSPLLNKNDLEHYRKALDTPAVKTAAALVTVATAGAFVMGGPGLLVGAATVCIGVGVMQIPEKERNNVGDKVNKALHNAQESALRASETLSSTCLASCTGDKGAEQVCCANEGIDTASVSLHEGSVRSDKNPTDRQDKSGALPGFITTDARPSSSPTQSYKNRRVACLRTGRIVPVTQIHALEPQSQPKAWLDVMASANTTADEKNEALEEIVILAKDKRNAKFLLEEGILDSLMFVLMRFLDKSRRCEGDDDTTTVSRAERDHAKRAAACCVTLGKAYCAAVHTEGDLMLMSLYERGTVPEERQLAQMLYEIPYHICTNAEQETFVLQQKSLPLAEDLATAIKDLSDQPQ